MNNSNSMSDDEQPNRVVLGNVSLKADFMGYSNNGIIALASPTLAMFFITLNWLPPSLSVYGGLATLLIGFTTIGVVIATPSHLTVFDYGRKIGRHYTQQQHMVHDSDPENSGIEQPKNESWPARIARFPLISKWRWVDAEDGKPTQSLLEVEKPYRGEYAVELKDGSLIGAIKIAPANMSMADAETWQKRVRQFGTLLASTATYKGEIYNPVRSVDYEPRRKTYAQRAREYRRRALRTNDDGERERSHILADWCEERTAVVGMYEDTTMVREHYFIVKVEPEEAVIDRTSDDGGLESIPVVRKWLANRRLKQSSEEHTKTELLDKLERRVTEAATALGTLEGVKTYPLMSTEFSKVIADHYRAANVYAYTDFASLVRDAPVPTAGREGTDPEHDLSYEIADGHPLLGEGGTTEPATTATDGGTQGDPVVEDESDDSEPPLPAEQVDSGMKMGLTTDEDELGNQYRDLLAPDPYDRSDPSHIVLDDEAHCETLYISDWPDVPRHGLLEQVLNFSKPGVAVTPSMHFEGIDSERAKKDIARTESSLDKKANQAEESDSLLKEYKREKANAAGDMKQALDKSDTGLFKVNVYIHIRAPTKERLEEAVGIVKSRLKEANLDPRGMKHNHTAGYQVSAPVCKNDVHKPAQMLGSGLAALMPWTTDNLVDPEGIELGIHEDRNEPTSLSLFDLSTGFNLGIFGTIGSGKTTTLTELLTRIKIMHPEIQLTVMDPLEEFVGMTEIFGGERVIIGGDVGLNVMDIEPTPEEELREIGRKTPFKEAKRRTLSFVESYYQISDLDLSEKRGTWEKAIDRAYRNAGITEDPATHHNASPTLRDVLAVIEDMTTNTAEYVPEDLANDEDALQKRKGAALSILLNDTEPFEEGGEYEHLARETDVDFTEHDFVYADLHRYENEADKIGLMMEIVRNLRYEQAKTSPHPAIFAMDESHYMLKSASDLKTLKQIVRHSRHSDLSLMFSTQSVGEFFEERDGKDKLTDNAKIIIDNMSVKIFHYLKEMNEQWAKEFDLTEEGMKYVKNAKPGEEPGQGVRTLGHSQALLQVDQEGSFPINVVMDNEQNPREFALNQFDPRDHGTDLMAYLREKDSVCHWSHTPGRAGEVVSE